MKKFKKGSTARTLSMIFGDIAFLGSAAKDKIKEKTKFSKKSRK